MGWFARNIDAMIRLPRVFLVTHIFCKFSFGVGLGVLLGSYLETAWRLWGWLLVLSSIALDAPAVYRILSRHDTRSPGGTAAGGPDHG